jgi:hypothetical protein
VRKWGWIVGVVFVDTPVQLVSSTAAAAIDLVTGPTNRWRHSMCVTSHATIDKYYVAYF